jgi:hypothetical protein
MADVLRHVPVVVYDEADQEHLSTPAEVCEACSDWAAGVWVPASFCPEAKAVMAQDDTNKPCILGQ